MKKVFLLTAFAGSIAVLGCSQEPAQTPSPTSVAGSKYLLSSEPNEGAGVIKVREDAKDKDDVVIVGRIGGSVNPWIEGRAAFSIVDPSLKSCAEIGSDDCPTPWDYC